MLRWRLISAAVILSVLLALVWLDWRQLVFGVAGLWLFPVVLAVSVLATEETLSLLKSRGHQPVEWILYLGNVLMPAAASLPMLFEVAGREFPDSNPLGRFGWPLIVLALATLGVFIAEMQRYQHPGNSIVPAALGVFTLTYVGLLVSFLALLRLHGTNPASGGATGGDWGMVALFSTLVIVKSADVGAYACGRTLGRHKMTPLLSPGKTWEGAAGGLLTAAAVAWAFFRFAGPPLIGAGYTEPPLVAVLAYGLILGIAGMLGDLAESLLKRDMQRKDSSTWLPGLGGVLDIIDAVLFAAPVSYVCWVSGLVGPGS